MNSFSGTTAAAAAKYADLARRAGSGTYLGSTVNLADPLPQTKLQQQQRTKLGAAVGVEPEHKGATCTRIPWVELIFHGKVTQPDT